MSTVIVTGAAGFIGSFVCQRLLQETGYTVIGVDSLNSYYPVQLKLDRLSFVRNQSPTSERFSFVHADLADARAVHDIFRTNKPEIVIHLAAQAGVRYSIEAPEKYVQSNLLGFFNVLESSRTHEVSHLVYASSSSVYGRASKVPYSVSDRTDSPVSLYAATKKSNEVIAHSYASVFGMRVTGLRFFTVYGPMGRPDMAYFKFADRLVAGVPIELFNYGKLRRDFTYIDDIVTGVVKLAGSAGGPVSQLYNIGNSSPVELLAFVETLERVLIEEGVIAGPGERVLLPMQAGDVYQTFADTTELELDIGFKPSTPLEVGLRSFARWYRSYHRL